LLVRQFGKALPHITGIALGAATSLRFGKVGPLITGMTVEVTYDLNSFSPPPGSSLNDELLPDKFNGCSSAGVFMYDGGPSP